MTVRDRSRSTYQVAALHIDSGPEWATANIEASGNSFHDVVPIERNLGGGHLPLLTREHENVRIYTECVQAWPIGRRIQIWGTMRVSEPEAPSLDYNSASDHLQVSRKILTGEDGKVSTILWEHVIIVRKWREVKD